MSKYSENMPPDLKGAIGWMYDHIKPGSVFLDFGCSTGYFGSLVKSDKQCQVYGVEISKDAEQARKVLDGVYVFDLDADWPQEIYERKYDYLFFGDVLEHLKDPGLVLQKCHQLLKRDGKIFVSIPNIAHISVRLELMGGSFEYEPMGLLDNTHLKYFTLDSFSRLANEAGYVVESVNSSLNDYPTDVIVSRLESLGLKPSNKFWHITDTVGARAYQYKFILTPYGNSGKPQDAPVVQKPEQERDAYVNDLKQQAEVMHKHANKQAKIIKHYIELSKQLQQEVDLLKRPLARKAASKLKDKLSSKSHKDKSK